MNKLEEIKSRLGKLTTVPWEYQHSIVDGNGVFEKDGLTRIVNGYNDGVPEFNDKDEAKFTASAPTDIKWLITRLEKVIEMLMQTHYCEIHRQNRA